MFDQPAGAATADPSKGGGGLGRSAATASRSGPGAAGVRNCGNGNGHDAAAVYDAHYYAHYCGARSYKRDPEWLGFFGGIAQEIVARIAPRTVLDAGCAMGMVVESLRDRGVEAYGVDISQYAIENAREDVRPYCWQGSILDPFPRRYDLIVCIEVLEHLSPREAERAVANFVAHTDDVLFSSTPKDFKETTHFNVQPPEWWAELFARHGFYRDVGFDASFITTWAVRFRRLVGPVARVIGDYERRLWWLDQDNRAQRELGLEQRNHLAAMEAELAAARAQAGELQQRLTSAEQGRDALAASLAERDRAAEWHAQYQRQVLAAREAVIRHVPPGETVAVISGGDDELVGLPQHRAWHFPRDEQGWHCGDYPSTDAEAVGRLEGLRQAGARWLLIPAHAMWWLEHYPGFAHRLSDTATVVHRDDQGVLYHLARPGGEREAAC